MATLQAVIAELEAVGTAQNRKVYARHGAAEPMFGVSYKELGRIGKPLRGDQRLAAELWRSGNHDARVLAARIADPAAMTQRLALEWLRDADNYILAEALGGLIAESPLARTLSDRLRDRSEEWHASVGWFIVACTAEQPDVWSDAELRELVRQARDEIDRRPNRVRHEMNGALIAIGLRNGNLRRSVLATARSIGVVQVDHGDTGCKTPEIAPYIERTLAHRATLAARRAEKARTAKPKPAAARR